MRPQYEGSLPHAIRAVIDDINAAVIHPDELLEYVHSALVIRQLRPAAKELNQARASLGMAAIASEQEFGQRQRQKQTCRMIDSSGMNLKFNVFAAPMPRTSGLGCSSSWQCSSPCHSR